ncbi:MAG: hypothetical protein K6A34_06075 [Methanobrevibacter sp.]|nr:hypothetical protein [Methanobrevibacter sp.]
MYNSLEYLLKKYPFFLDKKEGSNFTKTKKVFNNRLQDVVNEAFKVYLAGKIDKHVLIWKVQDQPHFFDIHFHVSLDYIKSVEIIRNYTKISYQEVTLDDGTTEIVEFKEDVDEVIYTESFDYEDNINKFEYLYEGHSETIIPEDKYKINVVTWEEYSLTKGFPENDVMYGDEYDHDYSLDAFGVLYNISRKQYISVDESQYATTEPPYNNQSSEDDYHYLQRLLYYIEHLFDTPLPVLEIYKLFGIKAEMLNRDRLIARMIDITRHTTDGDYNREWIPQRWEHKDQWCSKEDENLFFLANVNNPSPIQGQSFTFDFKVLNNLANEVYNTQSYNLINETIFDDSETPFLIVPYLNNMLIQDMVLYSNKKWTLTTEAINHENAIFNFKLFRNLDQVEQDIILNGGVYKVNEGDIVSEEILIKVRGCNTADWFVNPTTGNDHNNGTSKNTAFKTVDKALSQVDGEKNIITLMEGEHSLSKAYQITNDTNIITCPNDDVTVYCDTPTFFRVMQDKKLYLQNIRLRHKCCVLYAQDTLFINKNNLNNSLDIKIHQQYCMIETKIIDLVIPEDLIYSDNYTLTGKLVTVDKGTMVANEEMDLYIDGELHSTITTNANGVFTVNNISFTDTNTHTFQVKHKDHKNTNGKTYCKCESETVSRTVRRIPTSIQLTIPSTIYYNDNYSISGILLDENNNGLASKTLKVYMDNELQTITTNAEGRFTLNLQASVVGSHTIKVVYDELCRYLESEITEDYNILNIPTTLSANVNSETKLTNALTPENRSVHALIKSFSIRDHKNNVPPGTLQLLENNSTLETINTSGANFDYIPTAAGAHIYTLEYVPEYGYESKTITLTTTAVKTNVVITYLSSQDLYAFGDTVKIIGTVKTEDGFILEYGTLQLGLSSMTNITHTNGEFSKSFSGLNLGEYTCTASYVENSFFKAATKTFLFRVIEVDTVVYDETLSGEHQDITILDTVPSDMSGYAADDLILVHEGNYPKLLLQDTLDTTGLSNDDMILLDEDGNLLNVLISKRNEEE